MKTIFSRISSSERKTLLKPVSIRNFKIRNIWRKAFLIFPYLIKENISTDFPFLLFGGEKPHFEIIIENKRHVFWVISQKRKILNCTVVRFLWVTTKFDTCTVVSVNGSQVEDKMHSFKGDCAQFSLNRCPIYTHDGANAKFSTNSKETDNSVGADG